MPQQTQDQVGRKHVGYDENGEVSGQSLLAEVRAASVQARMAATLLSEAQGMLFVCARDLGIKDLDAYLQLQDDTFCTSMAAQAARADGARLCGKDCKVLLEAFGASSEAVTKAAATMSDLALSQTFVLLEGEHMLVERLLKHAYRLVDVACLPGVYLRTYPDCFVFASAALCLAGEGEPATNANGEQDQDLNLWVEEAACLACSSMLTQAYGRSEADSSHGHLIVVLLCLLFCCFAVFY